MTVQFPPKIQAAFDSFRTKGTFGAEADKTPMDMMAFVSFRDNTELIPKVVRMDGTAGDLDGVNNDFINCSKQGLQEIGKPELDKYQAQMGGTATAPEMYIHSSGTDSKGGVHDVWHLYTDFQPTASPNTPIIFKTMLTATVDSDGIAVGSNVVQVKDGKPVLDSYGMETFANEFLMLK